jgi:catechol 2,3-dioxygenase-like lactoylglutathione lyase family enzyme
MSELTLDHVVIAVRDLDSATSDYSTLLGRRPSWRGEHPTYGTRNTLFRIDNTYLELLSLGVVKGKDRRWGGELERYLEQRGDGLYALAIGTDDVDHTARELRSRGVDVLDPADGDGVDAVTGARRSWRNAMMSPKSSSGARVFFIEHRSPPDALPMAELLDDHGSAVKRMDHAVVLSADMEASRRLWADQLGVRLALDRTFPERNTRILFFRLGDITIEISGGAAQSQEGIGKPDRLWGIAWGVGSLEATAARIRAAGIDCSDPRPGIKPGTLVATARGPQTHGVATLLIEHLPESFRPESRAPQGHAYDNAPERRAFAPTALRGVTVTSHDAATSADRWRATLGLERSPVAAAGSLPLSEVVRLDAFNATIELFHPADPHDPAARALRERGPGMYSIAIEVDDLSAAISDLRAKGVTVTEIGDGTEGRGRSAIVDRAATNGVYLELIQRADSASSG